MTEHPHSCQDLLAQMNLYIDGELSPELCSELEKHLRECENCRVVINTTQKTIELYQEVQGAQSLPEDVRQRLYLRLNLPDPAKKV